jgi:hypothetical protein
VTVALPSLHDNLLSYLETGKSVYPGFRSKPGTKHPAFLQGLLVPIYANTDDELTVTAFKLVYQLCAAFKKLEGPYTQKVLRKQLADFVAVDESLVKINLHSPPLAAISATARQIITSIFKNISKEDLEYGIYPRPGSGATNSKVEKNMRYEPHVLYHSLHETFDYDLWFATFYQYMFGDDARDLADNLTKVGKVSDQPISRWKSIPKKAEKPRGICIEENEAQFFQQGVRGFMYDLLERHPETSGHVLFTDQTVNQNLALESSLTKELSTLDFSEASDRVWRDLVLYLFMNTALFEFLSACSTRIIELPKGLGQRRYLLANKFAPMGSGVCFPVMGLVHYALIKAIILNSSIPNKHKLCKEIYVYGDDVIIPTTCVQAVYDYLPLYGMKVNTEKSFRNSHFRESCGCHALLGHDITPVYFKYIITKTSRSTNTTLLLSLISKEFGLRNRGYEHTASFIRRESTKLFGPLPTVWHESGLLGWKTDSKRMSGLIPFVFKEKCHKDDPQQRLFRCRVVESIHDRLDDLPEHQAYLRKQVMLTRNSRSVNGNVNDQVVRWRWVPEPAFC